MITRKKKICKTCSQLRYIRSKGDCDYCAGKRYSKTTARNQRKNYVPKAEKNEITEIDVFNEILEERPHICFVTGKPIYNPTPTNFLHILRKAKNGWPHFKLYKKNIVLGLDEVHDLLDKGTEAQRQKYGYAEGWERLYKLRDELILEYKELYGK